MKNDEHTTKEITALRHTCLTMGIMHLRMGNYSHAIIFFEGFLTFIPNDIEMASLLAIARFKVGDISGAHKLVKKILAKHKTHACMYFLYAKIMAVLGDYETARASFQKYQTMQKANTSDSRALNL